MSIDSFLEKYDIMEYGTARINDLDLAPFLTQDKDKNPFVNGSVIVLVKQIPRFVFDLESKLKSFYLFQFMRDMDQISYAMAQYLNQSGYRSVPAATFFPVRIEEGLLKGMIPLKTCAAAAGLGSIGQNTLLISSRLGNRVCLSAVLCDHEIMTPVPLPDKTLCIGCGKCIEACPQKALTPGNVDIFKCLNLNYIIPTLMRPFTKHMMKRVKYKRYLELFLNTMGWNVDMVCSECLTACPFFDRESDISG